MNLTRTQAARFLGITSSRLKLLVTRGLLPELGSGGGIKSYVLSDLERVKGLPFERKKRKAPNPETGRRKLAALKELARHRGGECLATEYVNGKNPLPWRCAEGHTWWAYVTNVKDAGTWCRICFLKYRHKSASKITDSRNSTAAVRRCNEAPFNAFEQEV